MIDGKEGLVSREGLLKMIDDYVNLEQVRTGDVKVYAAARNMMRTERDRAVSDILS